MADIPIDITVTAASNETGGATFSMSGPNVNGDQIEFNKDKINGMKKKEHFIVLFTLVDNSGLNLRYVKPKENSMWARVVQNVIGNLCPPQGQTPHQFRATGVTDNTLTVRNKDDDRELIMFALNFIPHGGNDSDPSQYVQYDPIGDNRNGGLASYSVTLVVAIIVVVALVGAVAAFTDFL
jgi:hypothetical protein